jgi:glyoxylase-like metal-dependent hydrolase (beta-lactamase superfamily II)
MSEPLTFAEHETSDGAKIYRLPLEVFPKFWAFAYVVQKDEYCVLIDSGSGTDASHENLMAGLQQAKLQPSDLTHVFLTHAHIDHFGGLSKLRPITEAKIGCHELDLQNVAHHEATLVWLGRRFASFLAETGLAEDGREHALNMFRLSEGIYQSTPVDFTYEALDMQLGPFAFLHLPGHCPGHVAIRVDNAIFCGDMVVEGITTHLSPEWIQPFNGLNHYLVSLALFQRWAKDARLVFNGHDDVIADLAGQIEATKQNIIRRISRAIDALNEPLTIAEICESVYGETSGYNHLLVIEKTGAYVEYLYQRGMIEIMNPAEVEQGNPARYRRLREISDEEILPNQRVSVVE